MRGPGLNDLSRRLADLESVLGTRPNSGLRSRVEELGRSLGTLAETQAKLARDTKALETKVGSGQEIPQELVGRLTRLEDMLGTMSAADPAGQSPQVAAFAGRLAELQKTTREAAETAKAGLARVDTELSAVRTQAGRLVQRLDGLKGEVEERMRGAARAADVGPLASKLSTLEQELQTFVRSEAERNANAARVLLTLELANLKRAIDRGESYAEDLARVKKVAGRAQPQAPGALYAGGRANACRAQEIVPACGQCDARCRSREGRCLPLRPIAVGRARNSAGA